MPIVPTLSPTVAPQAGPFVPQNPVATPEAFGAGVGAATAGLGGALGDVSTVVNKVATDLNIQQSIRTTQTADTAAETAKTSLGFQNLPGGPDGNKGYFSLRGQDAVNYLPVYQKALQDNEAAQVKGFGDDQRAATMFQKTSNMRVAQAGMMAAGHANQQGIVADLGASQARQQSYADSLTASYNDPGALQNFQQVTAGEIATQGRINGWAPDEVAEKTKIALSHGYGDAITARLAAGDTTGAGQMFSTLAPSMDAATRVVLAERLKPHIQAAFATQWVNSHLMPGGSAPAGSGATDATGVENALLGQESGNNPNVGTSVDGARGRYQVTRGAFNDNAKPGQSFDNPEDVADVGHRMIQGYNDKYNGDVGRIATAYFSGPGNVAPAGSATPYLEDKHDGNGKSVSSYVNDVMGRMSQQASAPAAGAPAMTNAAYNPDNGVPPAVTQAASSNNAQRVASATIAHPDYDGLVEQAAAQFSGTGGDPAVLQSIVGEIRKQQAMYNMGVHTQQEALGKSLKDTVAALSDGQDVEIPEVAILHAFEGPKAQEILSTLHQAQEFGQTYKGVQFMPAADLNAARQQLADTLGTKAAMPLTEGKAAVPGTAGDGTDNATQVNPEGYAQRKQQLANMDAAIKKRNELLTNDPAGYAQGLPAVAAAFKDAGTDPARTQAAIQLSMSTQRGLGVQDGDIRAIPRSLAASIGEKLNTTTPDKGDMGQQITDLQKQYGANFPDVWKTVVLDGKVNPAYQMLAVAPPGPRAELQSALTMQHANKAKFDEIPPDQKQAFNTALNAQSGGYLGQFAATVSPFGGDAMVQNVVKPGVEALATLRVHQGMNGDAAVQSAYQDLVGDRYNFDGALRVPKGPNGESRINDVQAVGSNLLSNLTPAGLAAGQGAFTPAQARAGQWVTNPDESGMTLMAKKQGIYNVVKDNNGKPLTVPFTAKPTGDNQPPAPTTWTAP